MKHNIPGFALIGFLLLAAASLCWCVYRDVQIEKEYPGDLRNRVVGSRMQMDGLSPYFYHWKPADGLRYYDWDNYSATLNVSNVTATPFFHQLLYPVANLPQRTISKIWLALEYLALLIMTLLALRFAKDKTQKLAVLVTAFLFLYSYAWLTQVEMGQLYIFISLTAMLFYYFITCRQTYLHAILAGLFAASLLLIRPNTAVFLIPFLFLVNRSSIRYKVTLITSFFLMLVFAFGSSRSRYYWSDYLKAMNEQVKLHQDLAPLVQHILPVPVFERYEGWEGAQIKKDQQFPYYKHNGEHGNIFVLINAGLHIKTPLWVLSLLCLGFMILICFLYYRRYWNTPQLDAYSIALLGCLLYMASDIFSPVHRFHYNASQWLFPLLLLASAYSPLFKKMYVAGIFAGLLLNSLPTSIFPMEHTFGEYLLYGSVLGLLLTSRFKLST